jgi:hypothetical protein
MMRVQTSDWRNDMTTPNGMDLASVASKKVTSGALLTLSEVAAMLAVAPQTVHALPIQSIRLGRSLRFDPVDVKRLIKKCKEPIAA